MAKDRVIPPAPGWVDRRGSGRYSAINCVHISLLVDRCLILSHQVCRVMALNRKKLTIVEHFRSNPPFNDIVVAFRLMQERKMCMW